MRLLNPLLVVVCVAYLTPTCALAQSVDERRVQEQIEPYHKHHDRHHGHNHVYPDRGAIFREVPQGALVVNYAGLSYRFRDGVWFEPRGPAFIVVVPPIGLVVPTLPAFATTVESGGQTYLYSNDIYYRARPDLGGYEVVNDPIDEAATPAGSDTAAGAPATPAAAPTSTASGTVIATPVPTPAASGAAAVAPPVPTPTVSGTAAVAPPASTVFGATAGAPASSAPAAEKLAAASPSTAPAMVTAPTVPAAPSAAGTLPVLASGPSRGAKVFANPKNGQTSDEQARDHYECYRFAVVQSGFDPMRSNGGVSSAVQSDYERAQAACFEGRGYTIR